jgi:hypothetical protein
MATVIRCGAAVIALFIVAAGIAAENAAVVVKDAVDSLATRLESISRDRDMTTAKKAIVVAEAMENFNQQYKGKPLTVRLKIQDVVPSEQGQYLTASRPDLNGIQIYTARFSSNLSNAEVMSVTKDSVLVVTGTVSAGNQPKRPARLSDAIKPGGSVAFAFRANTACQLSLDNVSYQFEAAPKTKPDARPASSSGGGTSGGNTHGDNPRGDKTKTEQSRSVDDVKLFFLKGITQHPAGGTTPAATGRTGTGQSSGATSAKVKHNRIYTAAELIAKFGNPSSRNSKATAEEWVYQCKDGVVHVHFTQVGYVRSASKSETLKLEIKSVDSSSTPSTGSSRF